MNTKDSPRNGGTPLQMLPGGKIVGALLPAWKQEMLIALFIAGATARTAATAAFVHRHTARLWFKMLRKMLVLARLAATALAPLTGRVEVDECYIAGGAGGKKQAWRGRSLRGKFAIIGVECRDENGKKHVRLARARKVNAATICEFIGANVAPGTRVDTDCFRGYRRLARLGYDHRTVDHSRMFKNRANGACTNGIEAAWSQFKAHLARFRGGWRHDLSAWLAEAEERIECRAGTFAARIWELVVRFGGNRAIVKQT